MAEVVMNDEHNRMNSWALAIVFGPTLVNEADLLHAAGHDMADQLGILRLASNVCKFIMMSVNWRLKTYHGYFEYHIIR